MDLDKAVRLIESEWKFLLSERKNWSLTAGDQDMELVAHALRVILHMGKVSEFSEEYDATVAKQLPDGGWGRESSEKESAAWVSAFMALMLIRANVTLQSPRLEASVWKAIRYFLKSQHADGHWVDSEWSDLDTTSHPVSFFNVVLALGTEEMKQAVREPWKKGLQFILDGQSSDGGWYDKKFHPSGVETTAHLGQDSLAASFLLPEGLDVKAACERCSAWLVQNQAAEGSWDSRNMDHSMDSTRSLLLLSRMLGQEEKFRSVIEKGMEWIAANKNENGWPDFPGMETDLERTCDGLDVLLKYEAWREKDAKEIARRWGYTAGETKFLREGVGV